MGNLDTSKSMYDLQVSDESGADLFSNLWAGMGYEVNIPFS